MWRRQLDGLENVFVSFFLKDKAIFWTRNTKIGNSAPRERGLESSMVFSYSLDFQSISSKYRSGTLTPTAVAREVFSRIKNQGDDHVWTHLIAQDEVMQTAEKLERRYAARAKTGEEFPLYGLPFGVKDNVDIAGLPTTAACPAYKYTAKRTATVIQKLLDAGALLIGKTNLDQFANGLVGIRSPYGVSRNAVDPRYIPGGSSPGSAVAVAAGLVSFAIGTDTGGSGRVPAAYNNVVGLKPTRGLLSTVGLIPVNRGVDCPSVFALTCNDAYEVLAAARGYDPGDPYSHAGDCDLSPPPRKEFRFGIPGKNHLNFFGDTKQEAAFKNNIATLTKIGGTAVEIDFEPFLEAGRLLFAGPWVAERLVPVKKLLAEQPNAFFPTTLAIFERAAKLKATEAFDGIHRLAELRVRTAVEWKKMDCLAVPTTGTLCTVEAVQADPIKLNTDMGYYTYYVNLLVLSALAVPGEARADGLPSSLCLVAPAFADGVIRHVGARFHRHSNTTLGATGFPQP
jgi:allophanate hydrolase